MGEETQTADGQVAERQQGPDRATLSLKRILLGAAIGTILLYLGFLGFKSFQQWRLRRCLPLINSGDPEVSTQGIYAARSFSVIYPDRTVTRAIIRAVPKIKPEAQDWVLSTLGYWEGYVPEPEDVPYLVEVLRSDDPDAAHGASIALLRMGAMASTAVPELTARLQRIPPGDESCAYAYALREAIDVIRAATREQSQ